MKLLYLSISILPSRSANSIHVMKMCSAFAARGHEVTLIGPRYGERHHDRDVDDIFTYYGVEPDFVVRRLRTPYSTNFLGYLAGTAIYCLAIGRVIRKVRPDLVYGRYLPGCLVAGMNGYPTIYETHGPVWESTLEGRLFPLLLRSRGFRWLVTISAALAKMYEERTDIDPDRIRVAHDSADLPGDDQQYHLSWPGRSSHLQVGYFGSLYEGRGVELIVEMARRMKDMDFHIIGGDDAEVRRWQKKTQAINLFFHGYVQPSLLHHHRARCDVLLAPYRRRVAVFGAAGDTSAFMSPLKIFEYMSSRRAMVVSDLPVLREVLSEDFCLLVDPDDVGQWCSALKRLADRRERERLAAKAFEIFLQRHTWTRRAQEVLCPPAGCSDAVSTGMP